MLFLVSHCRSLAPYHSPDAALSSTLTATPSSYFATHLCLSCQHCMVGLSLLLKVPPSLLRHCLQEEERPRLPFLCDCWQSVGLGSSHSLYAIRLASPHPQFPVTPQFVHIHISPKTLPADPVLCGTSPWGGISTSNSQVASLLQYPNSTT